VVLQRNTRWNWTKKMEWANHVTYHIPRCGLQSFLCVSAMAAASLHKERMNYTAIRSIHLFHMGVLCKLKFSAMKSIWMTPLACQKHMLFRTKTKSMAGSLGLLRLCFSRWLPRKNGSGLPRSQEYCYNDWGRTEGKSILFKGVQIFYTL